MTSKRGSAVNVLTFTVVALAFGLLLTAVSFSEEPFSAPATGKWGPAGSMASARAGASAVLTNDGEVLVTGGFRAGEPLSSAELLTAGGAFFGAARMLSPRQDHGSVVLKDGRVLVVGGRTSAGAVSNTSELYDAASGSWSHGPAMTEPRAGASVTLLNDGRVLVAGGSGPGDLPCSTFEIFDPANNSFRFGGSLAAPRARHAAALLNDGRVLIAGGADTAGALASTEIFDPGAAAISQGPLLSTPRAGLTATALLDGTVLLAGGNDGSSDLNTLELYQPETGAIVPLGVALGVARSGHSAILLPRNNSVLIAGGTFAGQPLASAEIVQRFYGTAPAAHRVLPTAPMPTARTGATATGLRTDGALVVAGGRSAAGTLASADLYGFATLATENRDCQPGTPVRFTGRGWQPEEPVVLTYRLNGGGAAGQAGVVKADRHGRIDFSWSNGPAEGGFIEAADSVSRAYAALDCTGPAFDRPKAAPGSGPRSEMLAVSTPSAVAGIQTAAQTFAAGSLIIPMDADAAANHASYNQNNGMWKAYGLLYRLLKNGVPVYWTIQHDKIFNGADLTVSTATDLRTNAALGSWTYTGGPFVIDSSNAAAALPIIQAWWSTHGNVPNVHQAGAGFAADINVVLRTAPRIALEQTNSDIVTAYLNAAGIPDANGNPWGSSSPGILNETAIAGGGLFTSGACLTRKYDVFLTPHNSGYAYSLTDPANLGTRTYAQLDTFVHQGGGWTALCNSILSNENFIRDLTVNGSPAVKALFKTSLDGGLPGGFLTSTGFPNIDNIGTATWSVFDPVLPVGQMVPTTVAQALAWGAVGTWPAPGNPGAPAYYAHTERVASFTTGRGNPAHDNIIAGPYHDGTGLGKLTYIGGHSFPTTLPYTGNSSAPYLKAFYNSLFFNGSAVAKIDMITSPATFPQNGTQPFYASIVNTGGSVASNVETVKISLQSGVTYVGLISGPAPTSVSANSIVWSNIGDVQGGETKITIQLAVDTSISGVAGSKQFATFHATYGDIFGEKFTDDVCRALEISPTPGPSLTNTTSTQGPVAPGQPVTWVLTYGNPGTVAMQNAVLEDRLPAGFTYLSSSSSPSVATPLVIPGKPAIVRWSIGALPAGATGRTITLTATAGPITNGSGSPLVQDFTNDASLTGSDATGLSYTANASAQVTVQQPDLRVDKTVNQAYVATLPGTLTYSLRPRLQGNFILSNARVIDPLPAGATFSSAAQGGSYGAYSPRAAQNGLDGTYSAVALSANPTAVATGGTVTVTMTIWGAEATSDIIPDPLTPSDPATSCSDPNPASVAISKGGSATVSYTCRVSSIGETTFSAAASTASYDFSTATSNSVLVSATGAASVVTWSLGSNTPAVDGVNNTNNIGPGLYAFQGGNTTFWRYEIQGDLWSAKAPATDATGDGAALAYDGGGYASGNIYALVGGNSRRFSKYSLSGSSWSRLTDAPWANKGGAALVWLNGAVYALQGSNSAAFWKWDSVNSWTQLANVPDNVTTGGALATDGTYIYALRGTRSKSFYRYSPATNTWNTLASVSVNVKAGGSLAYLNGKIYALSGNNTQALHIYNSAINTWTAGTSVPARVGAGGGLATDGTYLYALTGESTTNFYRYTPSTSGGSWQAEHTTLAPVGAGGALVYGPGNTNGDRVTQLATGSTLVTTGDSFTVTMTLQSSVAATNVAPGALAIKTTNGASATCSGPSPSTLNLSANTSGTFTYTCTATSGSTPGSVAFSASATGSVAFPAGTSNSVIVSPVLTFVAGLPATAPGQVVNEAIIVDDTIQSLSSPVTTNSGNAALTILKSNSPSSTTTLKPGDAITYTLVVQNTGSGDATNVVVSDGVPGNTVYTTCSGGSSCTSSGAGVTWQVGTLASGQTATLTMTVSASSGLQISSSDYTITNSATVTAAKIASVTSNQVTNQVQVKPTITNSATPEAAASGDVLTYVLTVSNPGGPFTGTVTDVLPAGTTFAGGCSPACSTSGGSVSWSGPIPSGTKTFSFQATVTASGGSTVTNVGTLTPTRPSMPGIQSNDVTVPIGPTLSLVKTQSPTGPVSAGSTIVYALVASNESAVEATNAVIADAVPPGTNYVACSTTVGSCSRAGGVVTYNLGTVPAYGSVSVTMTVTVGALPAGTLQINNVGQISANNTAAPVQSNPVSNPVAGAPTQLLLAKSANPTTFDAAGTDVSYTYVLTNIATSTITGPFTVSDDRITPVVCPATSSLATGASLTCTATYKISQLDFNNGSITNTARATAGAVTSNYATATVTRNAADLSISKTDLVAAYTPGLPITYAVTVNNNGPAANAGFVVTDTLPPGTSFVSASSGCSYASDVVTCTSPGLAPNIAQNWTIVVQPAADRTGTLANTAVVTSNSTPDQNASNNSATDTDKQAIDAVADSGSAVTGAAGGTSLANVLKNDTVNGAAADASLVTLYFLSSTHSGVSLSGTDVVVAAGTPAGVYKLAYEICEKADPSNCDSADVTVPVTSANIQANNDNGTPAPSTTGGVAVADVLANDTLNGVPVEANKVTTSFVSSTNSGISLSGTSVAVAAGTPAGSYSLDYKICENLNAANCSTATVSLTVYNVVDAVNDSGTPLNGLTGGTSVANVLSNDRFNNTAATTSNVTIARVSSGNPGVRLEGTDVVVAPGTAAGDYTLSYKICDATSSANCDEATVTVHVTAATIKANNDGGTPVPATTGGIAVGNVLANDTLNGVAADSNKVTASFVSSTNSGVNLNGDAVTVAAGTPAGTYALVYEICEKLNPTNCSSASATVSVFNVIDATDDPGAPVSAYTGGTSVVNVLGNDTLNGVSLNPAMVSLTLVSSTTPGVALSGGSVVVAPGTPAGNHVVTYRICELASPSNCDTATVMAPVIAAADLALTKTDSSFVYMPGGTVSYTLSVKNLGPSPNAGFTVTDTLPVGLTFASGGDCTATGQVVTCPSSGLAVGATAAWTITVAVDPNPPTCLTNTAMISSTQTPDPVPANDSASDTDSALSAAPQSSGLGLINSYPAFTGVSTSTWPTTYNPATNLFSVSSNPATVRFTSTDTSHQITGTAALNVRAIVNNSGLLTGGVAGDDLVMTGTVTDQSGAPYSGTLLTGEATRFGYRELGATDRFEFRFAVTGGLLAPYFTGKDIGLIVSSEASTFNNSFTTSFSGGGKFTMGSLPRACSY